MYYDTEAEKFEVDKKAVESEKDVSVWIESESESFDLSEDEEHP